MTNKYRRIGTIALGLGFASFAAGCSGSDGALAGGNAGSGAAGSAGASVAGGSGAGGADESAGATSLSGGASATGVIVGDGKPFVPEDVTYSLVDNGRALTLISATMIDERAGASYWLAAFRNDETDPLCSPQVNAVFTRADHGGGNIDGQAIFALEGAMYDSDTGLHPCLQPGEIGMGTAWVEWLDSGTMKTVKIEYQPRGYIAPEAIKAPALVVGELQITSSAIGNVVSGSVMNPTMTAVAAPVEVMIFALDSVGRPTDFGYASSQAGLAVGGAWTFSTTIPSPVKKYIAFAAYGQKP